ncbi:TraY domain-containing protein [Moritella viscosa]|uniref:TraY domain-containing protein n=1 Tax=Moritella viscosa TaxID=80854 RepID=UPI00091D66A6|nr:TraY domain-containing protein [Moritella viscosa]SGZ09630.1 Putative uncharacterized protein [Moritella viscosa]
MTKKTKKTVSIHFEMSGACNTNLTASAKKAGRSKKQEASARLHDHLKRFPYQVWEEKD